MRDWGLNADKPHALRFAADARLTRTDYADDQAWELAFGGAQEPALAIQTKYGGRAGLARLVPMFIVDGRTIYETIAFAERPVVRSITPNYTHITAKLTNSLSLTFDLWVMESHAVGGRFHVENTAEKPVTLRVELFAQAIRNDKTVTMNLLGLDDGSEALHMGRIGNLHPIVILEKATPQTGGRPNERTSAKLTTTLTISGQGQGEVRWVHAGLTTMNESLAAAHSWLSRVDWEANFRKIAALNNPLPVIETSNADWDAVLGFGIHVLLRSFLSPTKALPHASFVTARTPGRGFSAQPDGSDHGRQWNGQTAQLSHFILPSTAILAPELAKGVIRNALAVQDSSGGIDYKVGLGGQRAHLLSLPLWATTTHEVYTLTEDRAFVQEALPALRRFFRGWFQPETDADGDAVPEWATVEQSGYPDNPTFARFRRWAQNADIQKVEAPDLAAYLIAEGTALLALGEIAAEGDTRGAAETSDTAFIQERLEGLRAALETMWDEPNGTYLYRERDTNAILKGIYLFRGKGDEAFDVKTPLDPPNRLIVRIIGGRDSAPKCTVVIEGIDHQGNAVKETIDSTAFAWYYGMGAAVSERVYRQVNYLKCEGIIRLYTVEVDTVDLTRQNLTQLLPLWAGAVGSEERLRRIVATLNDPARYGRPFGLPICPANDPAFIPNNDGGSGGVWMVWNGLFVQALLENAATAANKSLRGELTDAARGLFSRLMEAMAKALRTDHAFRGGYNSESGDGLGDIDEIEGTFPLALFFRLIGLRPISTRKVFAGGVFALPHAVTVRLWGMTIRRDNMGTYITFPTGYQVQVDSTWQAIEDSTPLPVESAAPPPPETLPELPPVVHIRDLPPISTDTSEGAIIPVQGKKDDTMEITIKAVDFETPTDALPPSGTTDLPTEPRPPAGMGGTTKIPVRRPNDD